jgi:hypothetical protein
MRTLFRSNINKQIICGMCCPSLGSLLKTYDAQQALDAQVLLIFGVLLVK